MISSTQTMSDQLSNIPRQKVLTMFEAVIVDFDMPLGSMVTFMVKWPIAAIPAIIVLAVIWVAVIGVFNVLGRAMMGH